MSRFAEAIALFIVVFFILESRPCSSLSDENDVAVWWKTTLVYEIWPRYFRDSDGDGYGDINGIIECLNYIKELGVETINLGPIYPSPEIDSGYDVSNYTNIHPKLGNISDFDRLIKESHDRDIKVILDVVPNHTSDKHKWFTLSVNRTFPYTKHYVWQNSSVSNNGKKLPPNNWMSTWRDQNHSAWTWNEARGQWYYHRFHESEPDLNLDSDYVLDEIEAIFKFWMEHGVDGFRILEVPHFLEDEDLKDEEDHKHPKRTFGLPDNMEPINYFGSVIHQWAKLKNSTPKYLLSGSYDTDENLLSYYDNGTVVPLNHRLLDLIAKGTYNATDFKTQIEDWLKKVKSKSKDTSTNWPLSNEGNWRLASKVGSDKLDALHMLSLLLPGQAFTYYGDEIGMSNMDDANDVVRTAMQWNDTTSAGFSSNPKPHVPINDNYHDINVMEQRNNLSSHLNVYKELAKVRKNPVFSHGNLELESMNDNHILIMRRTLPDHPIYVVVINMAETEQTINITNLYRDLNDNLDIVVTSGTYKTKRKVVNRNKLYLLPNTGIVIKSEKENKSIWNFQFSFKMKMAVVAILVALVAAAIIIYNTN